MGEKTKIFFAEEFSTLHVDTPTASHRQVPENGGSLQLSQPAKDAMRRHAHRGRHKFPKFLFHLKARILSLATNICQLFSLKSQLTSFIFEKMPNTRVCQLFFQVPTVTTHKRSQLSSQLNPKSALGQTANTLPREKCFIHTCHLLAHNTRDTPQGQQFIRLLSHQDAPEWTTFVWFTLSTSQEEHEDCQHHVVPPPWRTGRRQRCKGEHGDNGTRKCCEHSFDFADPESHREPALRSKDLLRTGRLSQGNHGKARVGNHNACFYGSGGSEAARALTCVR